MTHRVMYDLGCVCGRHFRRMLYHAVDVTQQTGLRYAVLAAVLNVVQCPGCERLARMHLPFVYDDAAHRRLVCVYPRTGEQVGELPGAAIQMVDSLEPESTTLWGWPRSAIVYGLESLVDLIAGDMGHDEQLGVMEFDVRPGIKPERAARLMSGRIALDIGGYVHSWREGGRLHLQILGPSARLDDIIVVTE